MRWDRVRVADPVFAPRRQELRERGIGYQWDVLNDRVAGVPSRGRCWSGWVRPERPCLARRAVVG
ncbi:hypothetical protein [Geochorda subterranea]|uniref:Uncharacterized protein n=1 Tax=Geochorda subterranea TaxID=3109564 RepID=A0ABZ1BQX8_9FIRM|nr:hypothetical protein [Limnochorda sp. LNt]WRP15227.1 hypothetical protein VLY81_03400 [Limnochorda sp. LNt]